MIYEMKLLSIDLMFDRLIDNSQNSSNHSVVFL